MSEILTSGVSFPQGKEMIQNLTSIATYFYHPQQFQLLKNVQEYNKIPVGYPSRLGRTRVPSVQNLMTLYLFFYWSLKCFYDEKKYYKEDEEYMKAFKYIT